MESIAEVWKEVGGEFPCYLVSNYGRIRNQAWGARKLLSGTVKRDGYLRVQLRTVRKERRYMSVHRLVACAFVEGFEQGLVVNHKNGIKTDNNADNLEWVTPKENVRHAIRTGLRRHRKLTDDQADEVRSMRRCGATLKDIGQKFNLPHQTIWMITTGKQYVVRATA